MEGYTTRERDICEHDTEVCLCVSKGARLWTAHFLDYQLSSEAIKCAKKASNVIKNSQSLSCRASGRFSFLSLIFHCKNPSGQITAVFLFTELLLQQL